MTVGIVYFLDFIKAYGSCFSGFLTGTLQNYARRYNLPIDHLTFHFHPLPHFRDQKEVTTQMAELKFGEEIDLDKGVRFYKAKFTEAPLLISELKINFMEVIFLSTTILHGCQIRYQKY